MSLPSSPASASPAFRGFTPAARCPSRERRLDECSRCVVRTLLALGLSGRDTGALVAHDGDAEAHGLRDSALLDRLVETVRRDPRAERRVRRLLEDRLGPNAARYRRCSLAELARLWSQDRHGLGGEELLALLWVVISRSEPACRSFEERLVEEISVLALQSLASAPARRASQAASAAPQPALGGHVAAQATDPTESQAREEPEDREESQESQEHPEHPEHPEEDQP